MADNPKPLSKEDRERIAMAFNGVANSQDVRLNYAMEAIHELLSAERFWREAVKKADGPRCPFSCDPAVRIDVFWQTKEHAADCPYRLAKEFE